MASISLAQDTSAPALQWQFPGEDMSAAAVELQLNWLGGSHTATNDTGGGLSVVVDGTFSPVRSVVSWGYTRSQSVSLPVGTYTTFDLFAADGGGRRKIAAGLIKVDGAGQLSLSPTAVVQVAGLQGPPGDVNPEMYVLRDEAVSAAGDATTARDDVVPLADMVSVQAEQVSRDAEATAADRGQTAVDRLATESDRAAAEAAAALTMAVQVGPSVTYSTYADLVANTSALSGQVLSDPDAIKNGSYRRATANDPSSAWVWFSRATVPGLNVRADLGQFRASLGLVLGDGSPDLTPLTVDTLGRTIRAQRADGVVVEAVASVAAGEPEFRAALGVMLGDGDPAVQQPMVDSSGGVVFGVSPSGKVSATVEGAMSEADVDAKRWRDQIGVMLGDGAPEIVPVYVDGAGGIITGASVTGRLVADLGTTDASVPDAQAYVSAGTLRIVGGAGGDRLLNGDAGRSWLGCQSYARNVQAVLDDGVTRRLVRVSPASGRWAPDGRTIILVEVSQSNGEGQTNDAPAVVRANPDPDRVLMPATAAGNVWLGQITSGGVSVQLSPSAITGLMPAASAIGDEAHGATPIESIAYALADQWAADIGFVPQIVVLNLSEGGQSAAGMSKAAGAGYYAYANVLTAVQAITDLVTAAGGSCAALMLHKQQTESDRANAMLGDMHAQDLADFQSDLAAITGQGESMLMCDWQMSSFQADPIGIKSLLAKAIALAGARQYVLVGPSYPHKYSSDYLHHTSAGHDSTAYDVAAAYGQCTRGTDTWWVPLHMVSASVTGANQITATWSEPILGVDDHPVLSALPAIDNRGIAVPGRTITGLAIAGATMVITTSTGAAGATSVECALSYQGSPRTEAAIPRSTIFSAAAYGTYPAHVYPGQPDYPVRKAAVHHSVAIS